MAAPDDSNRPTPRFKPPPGQRWHEACEDLLDEITRAAERIAEARDPHGKPIFRTDGPWRIADAVARSRYCLAIADLGRSLGVRKQVAHVLVHAAARAGYIDLEPNPHDRRILQALLTPLGRSALAGGRSAQVIWLATLLNGLGEQQLATATRVVRVIRQRLERDARELAQRKAQALAERKARKADALAQRERIPLQSSDHTGDPS
jgi:DNA-binding MarR family transcriptional regulator